MFYNIFIINHKDQFLANQKNIMKTRSFLLRTLRPISGAIFARATGMSLVVVFSFFLDLGAGAQNVGIGTSMPNSSAILDVTSTTKGFLPPRMTTGQRDAIPSPAAGLTIYNTSLNCNETYNGSAWVSNTHYIGESYGGGIVFYVYDAGQHGLIAAISDQGEGIAYYNGTFRITGTTGDGLNAGAMNTSMIIATQMADNQSGNFAAKVCADYWVTVDGITYGDWYLPSRYELNLLYLQKNVVGDFADYPYWSSTEYDAYDAWYQDFSDGYQDFDSKDDFNNERAIRAF
jgi:hypothetical protein